MEPMYVLKRESLEGSNPNRGNNSIEYGAYIFGGNGRECSIVPIDAVSTFATKITNIRPITSPEELASKLVEERENILKNLGHLGISMERPENFPELDFSGGHCHRYHNMNQSEKERFVHSLEKALIDLRV